MNNSYVIFKVSLINYKYILNKILSNNINIINSKEKEDYIYIKIKDKDYDLLSKLDYKKTIIFEKYYGNRFIKKNIISNIEKIIISLVLVITLFLSNNLILKVNIHTSDSDLKTIIKYKLEDYKIKDFSLRKKYKKLDRIKKKILQKYRNKIEWLEIDKHGYIYDIYLIKRKINNIQNDNNKCNYIAKKSGTITSIVARKGVLLVQENNFVEQGDILISGDIVYNEELKKQVCASGIIKGEVWYKINVSYPLSKSIKIKNKNKHYSLSLNFLNKKYKITKNKFEEDKDLLKIGNSFFGIIVSKSWNNRYKTIHYSKEDAVNNALKQAENKLLIKLPKNSQIMSRNILKKYINNGRIYIEVLLTVDEELGVVENY